jgi:hypothetical protein
MVPVRSVSPHKISSDWMSHLTVDSCHGVESGFVTEILCYCYISGESEMFEDGALSRDRVSDIW